MSYDLTKFKHGLEELNITLTDEQIEQFLQYYEMLVEKNKVMNLTGITEYEEVIQKHFLDSLSLIRVIPDIASQKLTVIDLGTGAGFPGIPLKIAFPELEIIPDGFSEQKNPVPSGSDRCTWPKKSICRSRKSRRDGFQCYAQTAV